MDRQTLDAFKEVVQQVALDLYNGKKAQGWLLRHISYYNISSEDGLATSRRASLSIVSNQKVHNEHYASFHAHCDDGKCSVEGISFATTKPRSGGLY